MDKDQSWQQWFDAAFDSLTAAQLLGINGHIRSSASRGYYAAYQAVTALLLYSKQSPPTDREAWSHEATPELMLKLPSTFLRQVQKHDFAARLGDLYKLRLRADYKFVKEIDHASLDNALKSSVYLVRSIGSVLNSKDNLER